MPNPADLLNAAIAASGLSARGFAVGVLAVDERTVRRWIAGDRGVPGTVLVVCQAIVDDPRLAHVFVEAAAKVAVLLPALAEKST